MLERHTTCYNAQSGLREMRRGTKSSTHKKPRPIGRSDPRPASPLRPLQINRLDAEEQDLLDSVESGEWRPVRNIKQEKLRYRRYAKSMRLKRRPF